MASAGAEPAGGATTVGGAAGGDEVGADGAGVGVAAEGAAAAGDTRSGGPDRSGVEATFAGGPPGPFSQDARRRNCSLSRPFVMGDVSSTRASQGELSRRGTSWLAALAWPLSSTERESTFSVLSQAS